jgi:hypothetical protein
MIKNININDALYDEGLNSFDSYYANLIHKTLNNEMDIKLFKLIQSILTDTLRIEIDNELDGIISFELRFRI